MISYTISEEQAAIVEHYWGRSWTSLSAAEVQEALDWWYGVVVPGRLLHDREA